MGSIRGRFITFRKNSTMQQDNSSPAQTEATQLNQIPAKDPAKTKMLLAGIPAHLVDNPLLADAIRILPPHYNFEIYKTLHRIDSLAQQLNRSDLRISLQFPEGLMLFACIISDILKEFSSVDLQTVVMADVTYGACCVDDLASEQMGCELLVHYGHSCLVPVTATRKRVLYVFVEIQIDIAHFVETVVFNFAQIQTERIHLMGTIQFNNSLFLAKQALADRGFTNLVIPQEKPRSAGEVLGCTSPRLQVSKLSRNIVIFLCDGRFHMQAVMIANAEFEFFQYDPYTRELTEQKYALSRMVEQRSSEITRALGGKRQRVCFIFGALGRQGNTGILDRLIKKIEGIFEYMVLIASQVNVELLTSVEVDFFVQIACPRLSIDWSYGTPKPLLTPYELYALVDKFDFSQGYRMDYYSYGGGPWSNFYGQGPQPKGARVRVAKNEPKIKLQLESCCEGQQCAKPEKICKRQ